MTMIQDGGVSSVRPNNPSEKWRLKVIMAIGRSIRIKHWHYLIVLLMIVLLIMGHYLAVMSVIRPLENQGGELLFETDYHYADGDLMITKRRQSGDLSDIRMYPAILSLDDVSGVDFSLRLPSTAKSLKGVSATLRKLKNCKIIDLSGRSIDHEICRALAVMPNLEYVNLDGTTMTDADLMELNRSASIQFINVFESNVTDQGIADFKDERPDITVWDWYH